MSSIRRIAATSVLALAASGLGVVAAQPASAAEGATLSWGVSQYLNEHLTAQSFTDGATESAEGIVTFTGGVTTGATTKYQGTASYSFQGLYSFAFSDVALTVDDRGDGTIAADVDWTSPAGPGAAEDIVLTTFSTTDDWADGSLTGTPDWLGVAPADSYGSGKPVDGASWAVGFVNALPSSVSATFYASGSNPTSDAKKFPAAFTATAGAVQEGPAVTQTTAYAGKAVEIEVSGSGFTAVTQPGDMGVYVGLAPAGGMPPTGSQEDMDAFADAEWVMPTQMTDGSFTVTLDPENQFLDPTKSYAIYTWQAHTHSNPSQDTETAVAIDFSKLGTPAKLKAAKKGKNLVVTVGDETAAGKVAVKLTKGKATKNVSAKVKKGVATVKLPTKPKGQWKAAVTYTSTNAAYRSATKTFTVKVG